MTEGQIEQLVKEAIPLTSAKETQISFLVKDASDWVIVLAHRGEELAIRIPETSFSTPDAFREEVIRQLRLLF